MTMPDLDAYVRRTSCLSWEWGVQDCTMWVADWCLLRWGRDPARRYRGLYTDEQSASDLVAGGLLSVVELHIDLRRKDDPDCGDIGVIEMAGRQLAAIWSGTHWLFRTPRGVGLTVRPAFAIWGD